MALGSPVALVEFVRSSCSTVGSTVCFVCSSRGCYKSSRGTSDHDSRVFVKVF